MYKAIPELFFETVKKYSNKPALLYKKEGVYFPITYKELGRKVQIFGSALQKLGIAEKDKIAIKLEKFTTYDTSYFGKLSNKLFQEYTKKIVNKYPKFFNQMNIDLNV